jgi:purine nucleosidase
MPDTATTAPSRRVRVVVDTDTGIDDALALVWLATRGDVEIVAVGSTHGNCRADQAAVNALRVLEACGGAPIPVAEGRPGPLSGDATFASHVHGSDGLGDAGLAPPAGRVSGESAVDQLVRLGREHPGQLDLLALGPLTNLGAALSLDPCALARYRSVVIMGGAGVARPAGVPDPTVGGDHNTEHDPVAAVRVYDAGGATMVGTDVTLPVRLTSDDLDRIASATSACGRLIASALPSYVRFHEPQFGPRTCCAHDALAAAVLTDPDRVTDWAVGEVAVAEHTAGARAILHRRPDGRSRSVVAMDGRWVLDRLVATLTRSSTGGPVAP